MTFVPIGQWCSGNFSLRKDLIKSVKSLHALQALFPLRRCPLPVWKLLGEFRSLGLLPLLFPALQVGRRRGRASGCTWCCVPGGFLPSRWVSAQREGGGGGVSLDFCPLRTSVLPLLQLLRELAKGELFGCSGLPLPAPLPRLSLPIPRRPLDDVGNRERLRRTAPACYPRVVPDLRIEEHVRIRELVHSRAALVTVAVVFALSPLPVRGLEVESVGGGHRHGRCLPVCDHVEIGRGPRTATGLGVDALILRETGLDPRIDTGLAGTALGVTGRVLRTATGHVVSVCIPQFVGEVGVTGRCHTIPPSRSRDRSHDRSRERLPSSSDRSRSGREGRRARRDQQEGGETVTVSQAPAVSEVSAGVTPVVGGTSLSTLPSAVQDLARFFLNLAGSSSLGAVGGVVGVAA